MADKTQRANKYMTVYTDSWSQCIAVDRVEVDNNTIRAYRDEELVAFIFMTPGLAMFVTEGRRSGGGAE